MGHSQALLLIYLGSLVISKETIDPPAATVMVVSPQPPFYSGQRVTLRCDIEEFTDWYQYTWFKNKTEIPNENSRSITFTLPQKSDHLLYSCFGRRNDPPLISYMSRFITVAYHVTQNDPIVEKLTPAIEDQVYYTHNSNVTTPHSRFRLLVPVSIAVGLFIIFCLIGILLMLHCFKRPKGVLAGLNKQTTQISVSASNDQQQENTNNFLERDWAESVQTGSNNLYENLKPSMSLQQSSEDDYENVTSLNPEVQTRVELLRKMLAGT